MNRESKRHQDREERRNERVATVPTSAAPDDKRRTSPPQFLREVRSELKKVNWPGRGEVVNYTIVELVTTLVLTLLT